MLVFLFAQLSQCAILVFGEASMWYLDDPSGIESQHPSPNGLQSSGQKCITDCLSGAGI